MYLICLCFNQYNSFEFQSISVFVTFIQEGWTPLHVAVQARNRDIAKLLLVNGADKTMMNKVT